MTLANEMWGGKYLEISLKIDPNALFILHGITKNKMIFYILLLLFLFIKNVSSFKEFFVKKRKQELYTNGMLLKFRDLVHFFFWSLSIQEEGPGAVDNAIGENRILGRPWVMKRIVVSLSFLMSEMRRLWRPSEILSYCSSFKLDPGTPDIRRGILGSLEHDDVWPMDFSIGI